MWSRALGGTALLIFFIPGIAEASSSETDALLEKARVANTRGNSRAIHRLVSADRASAYYAVDRLLNKKDPEDASLVDSLAGAYAAAHDDPFLQERVTRFRTWSPEQRGARDEAVRWKEAGVAAYSEGRFNDARDNLARALSVFRQVGDLVEAGRCLSNLGGIAAMEADGETALALLDEGRDMARRAGDPDLFVSIENNRAYALMDRGDLEGARVALESALPMAQASGDQRVEASILIMLGNLSLFTGDLPEAERRFVRAISIARQIDDAEAEASARSSLAAVRSYVGDTEGTARELRRAAELARRSGLAHLEADLELNLAGVERERGDLREASRLLARAREVAAGTEAKIVQAEIEIEEAILRSDQGRFAEALSFLEVAEELLEGLEAPALVADIRGSQATALFYLGEYGAALAQIRLAAEAAASASIPSIEASHRRGLGFLLATLGDRLSGLAEIEMAARLHEQMGNLTSLAIDLETIGVLRFRAGDLAGAREALERALATYPDGAAPVERAETIFDLAAVELSSGEEGRARGMALLKEAREAFLAVDDSHGIIETGLLEAESALDADDLAAARAALDRIHRLGRDYSAAEFDWRIRLLEGRLWEAEGNLPRAIRSYRKAVSEVEKLRGRVRRATWRAAILEDRIEPYRALARAYLSVGNIEKAYLAVRSGKARTFAERLTLPDLDGDQPSGQQAPSGMLPEPAVSLSRLRPLLGEGELLLDFFFDRDGLLVFLVRRDGIAHRVVAEGRDLLATVDGLIESFRYSGRPDPGEDPVTRAWRRAGARLGALLFDPLSPEIAAADHLLIVPHGPLHGVPFVALEVGGGYLIESRSISILPAAESLLSRRRGVAARAPSNLVIGDPAAADGRTGRLPGAEDEARRVARLADGRTDLVLGANATESNLRQRAGQFDRIHVAAHGRIDRLQPGRSFIALAPGDGEDGRLEAAEIASLSTVASLVVMSGCETAFTGGIVSEDPPGDERAGLVRAFLAAGSGAVIAGLWEMEDLAARQILPALYPRLVGHSAASALAELQRDLLAGRISDEAGRPLEHPFYWAGLQVYGAGLGARSAARGDD